MLAPAPAECIVKKLCHWDSAKEGGALFQDEFTDTGEILGQGITGAVRVVVSKLTGRRYARKILRHSQFVRSRSKLAQMKREIEILKNLDHPNIVRVQKVFEHRNGDISIVMELLGGSELFERLIQTKPIYKFKEADVRRVAHKMFSALAYLHRNNLVHRDVKCK